MTAFDPSSCQPSNRSSTDRTTPESPTSPYEWLRSIRSLSPQLARDIYTDKLLGVSDKLTTTTERQFFRRWADVLPVDQLGEWGISWIRALNAYGTPANFVDSVEFKSDAFRRLGQNWPSFTFLGGNYDSRRALMAAQKPYVPIVPLSEVAFRIAIGCLLCQNVLQGVDASSEPDRVANNIMLDLGTSFIVPNRYPSAPLHMLWLPKNHDDLTTRIDQQRVPIQPNSKETVLYLPTEQGKTRASLVSADDLAQIFHLCRSMDLIAIRNHTLSGMSLGWHDHWHLLPMQCYPKGFFDALAFGNDTTGDQIFRAKGTPFDVLVMQDHDAGKLAERLANLINDLERSNQIFCPVFVPTSDGFALVAPLHRSEIDDRYVQIGGAVFHGWSSEDTTLNDRVRRYVPLNYQFDWNSYVTEGELPMDRSYSQDEIHKLHRPINYRAYLSWGTGDAIWENMTKFSRNVYTDVLSLQDKRGDLGHADIVVYFTNRLARLMGLTPEEREAAVLAAILHDVGWSQIPNVKEVFSALVARMKSDDARIRSLASEEMVTLRVLHQNEGVKIARRVLGDHPYADNICRVIADHDTRYQKPESIFRSFLDADWLWRVTLPWLQADSAGVFDRNDPEQVLQSLLSQASPDDFFLPWAYHIARIELISTVREAQRTYKWPELPIGLPVL